MQKVSLAVKTVAVLLVIALQPVAAQYGSSYLGCFSFSRLLYLKGVEGAKVRRVPNHSSIDVWGSCVNLMSPMPAPTASGCHPGPPPAGSEAHPSHHRLMFQGLPRQGLLPQHSGSRLQVLVCHGDAPTNGNGGRLSLPAWQRQGGTCVLPLWRCVRVHEGRSVFGVAQDSTHG